MKLLTNRNGSYSTGTEIADAVLHYQLALARRGDVDIVDIPFVDASGATRRVELTIGWQVGFAAVTEAGPGDELIEVDTILGIYDKARSIAVIQARPFSADELEQIRSMDDWEN